MDRLELAFFSQAVRHAARLSRALCMQGGHAILMSSAPYRGRRSLTRLVALYNKAKIFLVSDPGENAQTEHLSTREHLKK